MVVIDGITYLDDVSWKDNSNCKGIKIMKEKMGVDENIYKQRTPEEEQALSDKNIAGMKKEQEEREAIQKRVADNKAAKKASTSATTAQVSNTPSSRSTNTLAPKTTADLISAYEQKKGILLTTDQMNELQAMYTVSEKISAKESTPPSSSTAQKTEPAASPFAE